VGNDCIKYMTGDTLGTCCSTEMKGMEFLINIGAVSGLSIGPKAQASKVEVLKKRFFLRVKP
jgi:hypothetical protein